MAFRHGTARGFGCDCRIEAMELPPDRYYRDSGRPAWGAGAELLIALAVIFALMPMLLL
jgi:hypothetical protein